MRELKVGEYIRTGSGYEQVLGFLHASNKSSNFIRITHGNGELDLSASHMVYTLNGETIPAGRVRAGDSLVGDDGVVIPCNYCI